LKSIIALLIVLLYSYICLAQEEMTQYSLFYRYSWTDDWTTIDENKRKLDHLIF